MAIPVLSAHCIDIDFEDGDLISIDFGDGPDPQPRENLQNDADGFYSGINMAQIVRDLFKVIWRARNPGMSDADVIEGMTLTLDLEETNGNILKLTGP